MIQNKTLLRAFSLAEVMVMLALLSIVLAASVKMITKRTSTITPKVSHGVYRCFYDNGTLKEQSFSGKQIIKPLTAVTKCSFDVPKAALYKIDLYSAGSGGNQAVKIIASQPKEPITTEYNVNNIKQEKAQSELFPPTDNDLYNYFKDTYIVKSKYTGDAGFGGGIYFKYNGVLGSSCTKDKSIINDANEKYRQDVVEGLLKLDSLSWSTSKKDYHKYYTALINSVSGWGNFTPGLNHAYQTNLVNFQLRAISVKYNNHLGYSGGYGILNFPVDATSTFNKWINNKDYSNWNPKNSNGLRLYSSFDEYSAYNNKTPIINIADFAGAGLSPTEYEIAEKYFFGKEVEFGVEHILDGNYYKNLIKVAGTLPYYYNNGSLAVLQTVNDDDDDYAGGKWAGIVVSPNIADLVDLIAFTLTEKAGSVGDPQIDAAVKFLQSKIRDPYGYNSGYYCKSISREGKTADYSDNCSYFKAARRAVIEKYINYSRENEFEDDGGDDDWYSEDVKLMNEARRSSNKIKGKAFLSLDDSGANPSWSWGVRIHDVTDDIIHEAIALALQNTDDIGYSLKDVDSVLTNIYDEKSVMNEQVKKQIRDYCMLEYKPIYQEYLGYNYSNNDDLEEIDKLIQYGKTRRILKFGGNEGLGKNSRVIYKVNFNKLTKTGTFKDYFASLGSDGLKATYCTSNLRTLSHAAADCDESLNPTPPRGADVNIKDGVNAGSQYVTSKEVLNVEYDANNLDTDKFKEPVANLRYVKVENAGSPLKYLRWYTPNGDVLPIKNHPTGGKGPLVYVDETDRGYSRPTYPYCDFTNWVCENSYGSSSVFYTFTEELGPDLPLPKPGGGGDTIQTDPDYEPSVSITKQYVAYTAGHKTLEGIHGTDTEFNPNTITSNYSVVAVPENEASNVIAKTLTPAAGQYPTSQSPSLLTKSWIWSKEYSIGAPGNQGNVKNFDETNLGTKCSFNIAPPGPIIQSTSNLIKNTDEYEDMIKTMSDKLTTRMTCKDKGGKVVFDQSVGNEYNPTFLNGADITNHKYTWNKNIDDKSGTYNWNVRPVNEPPATTWSPSSIWNNLINLLMQQGGDYDLNNYHIGAAGRGTVLNDYCLKRKGKFTYRIDYKISYPKVTDKVRARLNKDYDEATCIFTLDDKYCSFMSLLQKNDALSNETIEGEDNTPIPANGIHEGFDCYNGLNPKITKAEDGEPIKIEYELNADSPVVKRGLVQMEAGPGGGGAVVIMW